MKYLPTLLLLTCLSWTGCLQTSDAPDSIPEPTGEVRTTIANSLQQANQNDCLLIYGIYTAAADYVEGDQLQATDAADLYRQLEKMFALADWPTGRYPDFTTAHEQVMDPLLSSPNETIMDRRADIAHLFRQIALGAQDATR